MHGRHCKSTQSIGRTTQRVQSELYHNGELGNTERSHHQAVPSPREVIRNGMKEPISFQPSQHLLSQTLPIPKPRHPELPLHAAFQKRSSDKATINVT